MLAKLMALLSLLLLMGPNFVLAHFQVIHLPKLALTGQDSPEQRLQLFFTHPFEGGPVMEMGRDLEGKVTPPRQFGVLHKEEWVDLTSQLQPISFQGRENAAGGYALDYRFRGLGDFVFFLEPAPYYDAVEDSYIQHVTKVIANRGGLETDWNQVVGLPVEIVPINKPYALWAGNVFEGIVLRKNGSEMVPVPNAEIEVEFLNFRIEPSGMNPQSLANTPQESFVTQVIRADDAGRFRYGIPRAGWWGFAAIDAGGEGRYRGKALEQGAVLWLEAVEMK